MKKIKFLVTFISLFLYFCLSNYIYAYESSVINITNLDICKIQDAIDKGYLTYEKLTKLYLDRINEYDNKYNAIININKNAVLEAKKCDEIYIKNGRSNMLFGIPIILKDNIDYTELPTTAGTTALKDSYPNTNSKIVENLLNAGAIILAKSNMSEFAFSSKISYSCYGTVKNAYNLNYTTYGSSGGSVTAVAASFATCSIGTDTNSSIRLPASASNLVGLRPTKDILSTNGIIAYDVTRDTPGPITKTVQDNAILLTCLANNGIDYTAYLKKDGLNGKKIGIITDFLDGAYEEITLLFNNATKKMEKHGATLIEISSFYNSTLEYYNQNSIYGLTMAYQFNKYIKNTNSSIKSFSDLLKNGGFVQDLKSYKVSVSKDLTKSESMNEKNNLRQNYIEYLENLMDKYNLDALMYPTSSNKLLTLDNTNSSEYCNNSYKISPTTGYPAINIPLGFDSDGLPYGFEILARPNKENILYEIAYSYEQIDFSLTTPNNISPNLYKIDEKVKNLVALYEQNIGVDLSLDEKTKQFFLNYENTNENISTTEDLIKRYEDLDNNNLVQNSSYFDNITLYILVAITMIILINFIKKRKENNNKKKKKKNKINMKNSKKIYNKKVKTKKNNTKNANYKKYDISIYNKKNDLYMKKLLNNNNNNNNNNNYLH